MGGCRSTKASSTITPRTGEPSSRWRGHPAPSRGCPTTPRRCRSCRSLCPQRARGPRSGSGTSVPTRQRCSGHPCPRWPEQRLLDQLRDRSGRAPVTGLAPPDQPVVGLHVDQDGVAFAMRPMGSVGPVPSVSRCEMGWTVMRLIFMVGLGPRRRSFASHRTERSPAAADVRRRGTGAPGPNPSVSFIDGQRPSGLGGATPTRPLARRWRRSE